MLFHYSPQGVCSRQFHAEVNENGVIQRLNVDEGCNGYGKGLGQLVTGRRIDEVIPLLSGITCGRKKTSCPDQIAKMLTEIKGKMESQSEQQ